MKKRLILTRRGHKLLKDKQEQLLSQFYRLIEESRGFRESLEKDLIAAAGDFLSARAPYTRSELSLFLFPLFWESHLTVHSTRLLNIYAPRFDCHWKENVRPFAAELPLNIFFVIVRYRMLYEEILRLAELETMLALFAKEIEKTRRRVNSLEYILIPELERAIRSIEMRLEETERENFIRLRHIKQSTSLPIPSDQM